MTWAPTLLLLVLLGWTAACLFLYRTQARRLYPGDGLPFGDFEALAKAGGEAVEKEVDARTLRYYRVPPGGEGKPRAWVLHFHGNRHGARERFDFAERFAAWGLSTVLAEYPGYAGDAPTTDQGALVRYGLAMADESLGLAGDLPLFVVGESLGTAIATYVCVHRPVKGLLLSTPFTSLAAVAQRRYPWLPVRALIKDPMPAELWAPHVRCPVFMVHGTRDKTVPYDLGQAQALRFPRPPEMLSIDGPGHSDIRDRFPDQYWGGMQRFMERCLEN